MGYDTSHFPTLERPRLFGRATQENAIELCIKLEEIAPRFGGHVALTGGTLYKQGTRKDIDVMIYRSKDEPAFNWAGFFEAVAPLGIVLKKDFGYAKKAELNLPDGGQVEIDFFDPHAEQSEEYGMTDPTLWQRIVQWFRDRWQAQREMVPFDPVP